MESPPKKVKRGIRFSQNLVETNH